MAEKGDVLVGCTATSAYDIHATGVDHSPVLLSETLRTLKVSALAVWHSGIAIDGDMERKGGCHTLNDRLEIAGLGGAVHSHGEDIEAARGTAYELKDILTVHVDALVVHLREREHHRQAAREAVHHAL